MILAHSGDQRELKVIRYKANGAAHSTKVVHTAADIDQAFFDSDGSILVLTEGATLRLAADGSTIGSGAGIANLTYGIGEYETGFAVATITRDHKLLVTSQDEDGDLMLSRYLLA